MVANTFIWFVERSEINLYKLLWSVWCCEYKKTNENLNSVKPK